LLSARQLDKIAPSKRVRAVKHGKKRKGPTMPTGRQEKALIALLSASSLARAAEMAGITEKTLRNWMARREFAEEYRKRRMQLVEAAIGSLQAASSLAVDALVRNLNCGRPASEIAAANSLLERSLGGVEMFDLIQRIGALEERLQGGTHAYNSASANGQAHDRPVR
jgi:hypothetical protein